MSSFTDFLFEGRPPQSVTTYGQTVENIPKWMSDYTQGLIARANAAAAEPYIPYGGPRIAGFSPEEEASFGLTEANIGAYQPYFEAGASGFGGGLSRAANIGRAAAPFIQSASQRFIDPGVVDAYMNPYVQNVLNRQESLAQRTLQEDFLPQLQKTFAGAGQYGSRGGARSMEDIGMRGIRDIQEGLEEQRLATLGSAYGQAADIFGRDVAREAELGRLVGGLEEAGARAMFSGAAGLGQLGEAAQRAGYLDAAALSEVGRQRRGLDQASLDLAYQDFLEQRNLPFERLGFMSNIIRGIPYQRAIQTQQVGPASVYQPSPLSQLVGAYGVYRGLGGGQAEGGYIEGEYEEMDDVQEYALGGLARAAGEALYGMGKRAVGALSRWARSLYPDPSRSIGVMGGKLLKLDHKQD